jgi:hypothetical protein
MILPDPSKHRRTEAFEPHSKSFIVLTTSARTGDRAACEETPTVRPPERFGRTTPHTTARPITIPTT